MLQIRAASHGKSKEDEASDILRHVLLADDRGKQSLAEAIRARIDPIGGVDLAPLPRFI